MVIIGDTYNLTCSVTVSGSNDQPTITWLDPMNNQITSEMVNIISGNIQSRLTFESVEVSAAGTYICKAELQGNNYKAQNETSTNIIVESKCS